MPLAVRILVTLTERIVDIVQRMGQLDDHFALFVVVGGAQVVLFFGVFVAKLLDRFLGGLVQVFLLADSLEGASASPVSVVFHASSVVIMLIESINDLDHFFFCLLAKLAHVI